MKSGRHLFLGFMACAAAGLVACSGGGDDDSANTPDAAPIVEPVAPWMGCADTDEVGATVVVAHDHVDHYVNNDPRVEKRDVDAEVDFPAGNWRRVLMRVELDCPADGKCDIWDRAASISLVEDENENTPKRLELARYMTPYRTGFCFVADVTDLASHLSGHKKLRSFIDTWVSQDDAQNGHGWRVTTKFLFHAGTMDKTAHASEVIPLWNNQAEGGLVRLGDPMSSVQSQMPSRKVTIPADAKKVALRYLITGHGQGGLANCAEFCQLDYTVKIGAAKAGVTPWRSDCANNPVSNQAGTWMYDRAGWCPGSYALPQVVDITDKVTPGAETTLDFTILKNGVEYVNTCRPSAVTDPSTEKCTGCVFNQNVGNCKEDGNGHTPAEARIGVQMLIYR
jgi:hypothetical protein